MIRLIIKATVYNWAYLHQLKEFTKICVGSVISSLVLYKVIRESNRAHSELWHHLWTGSKI